MEAQTLLHPHKRNNKNNSKKKKATGGTASQGYTQSLTSVSNCIINTILIFDFLISRLLSILIYFDIPSVWFTVIFLPVDHIYKLVMPYCVAGALLRQESTD